MSSSGFQSLCAHQFGTLSGHVSGEEIDALGCAIVLRRVDGPEASEFYLSCQPPEGALDAGQQTESIYRAIISVLENLGAESGSIVSETVFLQDLQADIEQVREARQRVLAMHKMTTCRPAMTEIEQPPLKERARVEVSIQAVLPNASPLRTDIVQASPTCGCSECARSYGLRVRVGDEERFHAGNLYGRGEDAYEQTLAMFSAAENLLQRAGMQFTDVVRAWIHLRDMDRDYPSLNRARREFFTARGIDPVPASTGIGGGPVPGQHDLCLGIYAVKGRRPTVRRIMTSPTLNDAGDYGADFVRGMRVEEANRVALLVSGTASVDEAGRTAHPGNFEAQADRMLVNVASLLAGQGATFADVVSAVTYLKHPADVGRLKAKFREAGYQGFPNVLVAAPVCRPDLLCETEAIAVLPAAGAHQEPIHTCRDSLS